MGLEHEIVKLTSRIDQLEARLAELETASSRWPVGPLRDQRQQPQRPPGGAADQPPPPAPTAPPPPRARPAAPSPETVLKWAGLGLVVLAAALFVSTAINRGWIGPELQLAGATAVGLALLGGGIWLAPRNRSWGVALAAGGAVVAPLCAAAANAGLGLLGNDAALAALAIVAAGLIGVAWHLRAESVVAVAAVGAAVLPFWIVADQDVPLLVVGAWLATTAVVFATVGIVRRWLWCRLVATGLCGLLLAAVGLSDGDRLLSTTDRAIALAVVAVFALVAWSGPAVALARSPARRGWRLAVDHRSVLPLPMWTWGLVSVIADIDTQQRIALAGLAIAAAFLVAAGGLWRVLARTLLLANLLAVSLVVSVALIVLTGGPALLVALTVQGLALALIAHRLDDLLLGAQALALITIAIIWAALAVIAAMVDPVGWGDHLANLAVVLSLLAGAGYCRRLGTAPAGQRLLMVLSWVGGLGWLASVLVHGPQGQVVVSVIWAAAAGGAIVAGIRLATPLARQLGMATLAVVLVKLLTVDLSEVDTLWRVGLFLVIGAGLLRLGYLVPKLTQHREPQ